MFLIISLNHVRRDGDESFSVNDAHLLNDERLSQILPPLGVSDAPLLQGFHQGLTIAAKLVPDPLPLLPVKIVVGKVITLGFVLLQDQPGFNEGIQHRLPPLPDPLLPLVIRDFTGLHLGFEVVLFHLGLPENLDHGDGLVVDHRRHAIIDRVGSLSREGSPQG